MTEAERRFRKLLTQTCTISRQTPGTGTDEDLVLGTLTVVATGVPCALQALSVSADLLAVGPVERDVRQLFVLPTVDLQRRDLVTDADGVEWVVDGVPQTFQARGIDHHIEALVSRKAVQ